MSALTEWVKNIFIIVVAISFLEILLPVSSMNKYLKYIFSIMILAIIISPLQYINPQEIAVFEPLVGSSLQNGQSGLSQQNNTVDSAEILDGIQTKQIETIYREKMEQSIKDEVLNEFPGISRVSADIYINNEIKSKNFGKVQSVTVFIDDMEYEGAVKTFLCAQLDLSKQNILVRNEETGT